MPFNCTILATLNATAFQEEYASYIGWTGLDGMIFILAACFVFYIVGIHALNRVLHWLLPDTFGALEFEKKRATVFQITQGLSELVFLFVTGALMVKRFILSGQYPDTSTVQGERITALLLFAMYVVELVYRQQLSIALVLHHVTAMVNIGLVLGVSQVWSRTYNNFLCAIAFFTCLSFPQYAAVVAYRMYPAHIRTYRLVQAVTVQECLTKTVLQGVNIAILATGIQSGEYANLSAWRYVITFGSFILLVPAQYYGTYVLSHLWRKLKLRHAAALSLSQ